MDVRVEPAHDLDERAMLVAWLEFHRATLESKCATIELSRLAERGVAPSGLSLLGLVRHLTEVESYWFRTVLADRPVDGYYYDEANPDGDFDDVDGADPAEALARWRAECDHSRIVLGTVRDLGAPTLGRRDGKPCTARWVLVHLVEEYARHNGHADLLREALDGATGE
ncbi:MAG: DinB family protein [Acidimicrobiia bacterium]|nr:DinB family protein [Acidimicrobiia bacterium]